MHSTELPFHATGWKDKLCWVVGAYQQGDWPRCDELVAKYNADWTRVPGPLIMFWTGPNLCWQ